MKPNTKKKVEIPDTDGAVKPHKSQKKVEKNPDAGIRDEEIPEEEIDDDAGIRDEEIPEEEIDEEMPEEEIDEEMPDEEIPQEETKAPDEEIPDSTTDAKIPDAEIPDIHGSKSVKKKKDQKTGKK